MSQVIYTVQNPTDPDQMYAFWDTGRVDAYGGALPILDGPDWFNRFPPGGRAVHIVDWDIPSGYVLDYAGGFQGFGGVPDVGSSELPYVMPGVPYTGGVTPKYVDMQWDPDGTGQGYALDHYGQVYDFGGATPWPRSGPLTTYPLFRRLEMQWEPFKRAVLMDGVGGRWQDVPSGGAFITEGYYDVSRDWARDLKITDWGDSTPGDSPSGYMLLASGIVIPWGPNPPADAFGPTVGNQGTRVGLEIISLADPLTLAQFGTLGQFIQYEVSTPPTVLAGGDAGSPALVVTDTTTPTLAWSYSDPQSDSQAAWQLLVYSQAFVDANDMTSPRAHRLLATVNEEGTDRTIRGIASPVDLDNGEWRMYVRAQDTSGLWSDWDNRGWEQDVPLPTQPDDLLATVDEFHVNLSLTTASPDADLFTIFEYQDDGDTDWTPVRGAEAVTFEALTLAVDLDIPMGIARTYRARTFKEAPRVTSLPSPEQTVSISPAIGERLGSYVITHCDDPTLGGEFSVISLDGSRPRNVGVFQPLNSPYPIVVSDGGTRSWRGTVQVRTLNRADYVRLRDVITLAGTLVVRDQFGNVMFCQVTGDWADPLLEAMPLQDEITGLRHAHEHGIPLVEVARPAQVIAEDPDS